MSTIAAVTGRFLIFVPEISADTFVLFYAKGPDDRSFSVRDYLTGTTPSVRYAKEFDSSLTASRINEMAQRPGNFIFKAKPITTKDLDYWRRTIRDLNSEYLGSTLIHRADQVTDQMAAESELRPAFSMLDLDVFVKLPKYRKTEDVRRIYSSPVSEDWVIWNVLRLLERRPVAEWWPRLLGLPSVSSELRSLAPPLTIEPWVQVRSPPAYEAASRARMLSSEHAHVVSRAQLLRPVEGKTEIDVVVRGLEYLLFVEAKLGSDISVSTTYDPARNQIVRNIDCVIEESGSTDPLFWMWVKDRESSRMYVQVLRQYRGSPGCPGRRTSPPRPSQPGPAYERSRHHHVV